MFTNVTGYNACTYGTQTPPSETSHNVTGGSSSDPRISEKYPQKMDLDYGISDEEILKVLAERTRLYAHPVAQLTVSDTPVLGYVARRGKVETLRALLEAGADINEADPDLNRTPLMRAAFGNNRECLAELLLRGARTDLVDRDGKTALRLANEKGDKEVVEMLESAEAKNQRKSPQEERPRTVPGDRNIDQQSTPPSQRGKTPQSLYVTGVPTGTYKKLENVHITGVQAESFSQLPRKVHVSLLGEGSRVKTIRNASVIGVDLSAVHQAPQVKTGVPHVEIREPSPGDALGSSDEFSSSDEETPKATESKKRKTSPAQAKLKSSDESSSSEEETPKAAESKKRKTPSATAKEEKPRTVPGGIGTRLTENDLRRIGRQISSGLYVTNTTVYNDAGGPGRTEMHDVRVTDVDWGVYPSEKKGQ